MAVSRKHYREAASIIKRQVENYPPGSPDYGMVRNAMGEVASDLASMFKGDNSAFNRQQFMEACGL